MRSDTETQADILENGCLPDLQMKIEYKPAQDLQISVVDNEIIRGYMKQIQQGELVDPVRVLGTRVKDGNHRAAAYKLLGRDVPTIPHETLR